MASLAATGAPSVQAKPVPQGKVVRYSAGESIVLEAPSQPPQYRVPAAARRYSAGDSIVLGAPEAVVPPLAAAPVQDTAEPSRTAGFSQAAAIPLASAFADSATTYVGIHHMSLAESNALVNTSAIGLVGLFAVKAGVVYYFDHQPKKIRAAGLKATAGVWSGVTMSNVLLIAGASNPIGLVGGMLFGACMYHREGVALAKESARQTVLPARMEMAKAP